MAASCSTIVFIMTIFVLATSISATEYIVGDQNGWSLDFDYQTWTKDKVFYVGDKLGTLYSYKYIFLDNACYIVFNCIPIILVGFY